MIKMFSVNTNNSYVNNEKKINRIRVFSNMQKYLSAINF